MSMNLDTVLDIITQMVIIIAALIVALKTDGKNKNKTEIQSDMTNRINKNMETKKSAIARCAIQNYTMYVNGKNVSKEQLQQHKYDASTVIIDHANKIMYIENAR